MADKKSFVMYSSWATMITEMPDEQAAQLIKAICAHQIGKEYTITDPMVCAVYSMIEEQMNADADSYAERCQKRSENAKRQWEQKQKDADASEKMQMHASASEKMQVHASAFQKMQMHASAGDTDTESDSEYESDTESDSDKELNTLKNTSYSSCSERFENPSEPEADVEAIQLNDGSDWRPTQKDYEEWQRLFPAVDVPEQFRKMRSWSLSNPALRKTKRGIKRFVNTWLSRAQDNSHRGRDKPTSYVDAVAHRMDSLNDWVTERNDTTGVCTFS